MAGRESTAATAAALATLQAEAMRLAANGAEALRAGGVARVAAAAAGEMELARALSTRLLALTRFVNRLTWALEGTMVSSEAGPGPQQAEVSLHGQGSPGPAAQAEPPAGPTPPCGPQARRRRTEAARRKKAEARRLSRQRHRKAKHNQGGARPPGATAKAAPPEQPGSPPGEMEIEGTEEQQDAEYLSLMEGFDEYCRGLPPAAAAVLRTMDARQRYSTAAHKLTTDTDMAGLRAAVLALPKDFVSIRSVFEASGCAVPPGDPTTWLDPHWRGDTKGA